MAESPRVAPLTVDDIPALLPHLVRNALESGRDGEPFSRARSADDPPDTSAIAERLAVTWARPVDVPGWERGFGLWVGGELRGHLDLIGGEIESELHRAHLGMGIERPHRRAGWGSRLLGDAITWARGAGLAWIDLGVFTHNAPAHALYVKHGFVEVGVTVDRVRIDGQSLDDRAMVLRL
ncbi:MAG: GNAT family N-acetyltransferase [Kofleriaceae bacterium]|nr:GNAT family N-acetyltransferase [Kofleriaceae bacterium]